MFRNKIYWGSCKFCENVHILKYESVSRQTLTFIMNQNFVSIPCKPLIQIAKPAVKIGCSKRLTAVF